MSFSLVLYRQVRQTLRAELRPLLQSGLKRVALYGDGEAAELAYLTVKETGLEPMAVFADTERSALLGVPVYPTRAAVDADVARIIVCRFGPVDAQLTELTKLGLRTKKLIFLGTPGA
jgi:hypothetical protein